LSNGALVSVKESKGRKTWHWRQDVPHVAYLINLVAGEYKEVKDSWNGVEVSYYHHPGDEQRARNAFATTPEMVRYFTEKLGVRYPFARYAQIPVTEFFFGGMEHTSSTTITDRELHDDRAKLDFSSNPLVSHELAHQWFGNLVTCKDWSHAWLNEGFATYMDGCWIEHELGAGEFQYTMLQKMEGYLKEDSSKYRRPIVCNRFEQPIDLFDRHLYAKGACVLHLLRAQVGDERFWASMKEYLSRHAGKSVVTQDFATAVEDVTGFAMDGFFAQWVYGQGHPALKLSLDFNDKRKAAELRVAQTQTDVPVFTFSVDVALHVADKNVNHRIAVTEKEQTFSLPCDKRPDFITFDVGNTLLKTLDLSAWPQDMLIAQLKANCDVVARIHAARELGKRASQQALNTLIDALKIDAPWYVTGEVALALGKTGRDRARDALIAAMATPRPKARRMVVKALGEFVRDEKAGDALIAVINKGDASYYVEAEACSSLGAIRDPRVFDVLPKILKTRESHNDVIRSACLDAFAASRDSKAIELILPFTKRPTSVRLRQQALNCLGKLGAELTAEHRTAIRRELEDSLWAKNAFVLFGAADGLVELGDKEAVGPLKRLAQTARPSRVRLRAERAAEKLADKSKTDESIKTLKDELEQLKKDHRKLVDKVEALQPESKPS
ncbi:MAG: HEAT repeat domain-containing protein, partial [Planctomycetaceae bacterium]|nr:HEAT repeat domain-containing protein [Planctomycetaceae bacterium]